MRGMVLVYRYRVKSLNGLLNRQSRAVNYVWNFCNDTQKHALKWGKRWPSGFDLNVLTTGSSKELGIHSGTINATCEQYAKSRSQHKRPYLRYRGKRTLGWVPLKGRDLKREGTAFRFAGKTFRVFLSRPLPEGKIKDGTCFAQDARGNWFLNIVIETPDVPARPVVRAVGIDLGLKDFAKLSNGETLPNDRYGQRAAEKLARTKMAKSVYDASWSSFRDKLRYKAIAHGAQFEEVNEAFSSVTCSACHARSGPSGLKGLRIRAWRCGGCGSVHDRDINAALNILRCGRASPVVGITRL